MCCTLAVPYVPVSLFHHRSRPLKVGRCLKLWVKQRCNVGCTQPRALQLCTVWLRDRGCKPRPAFSSHATAVSTVSTVSTRFRTAYRIPPHAVSFGASVAAFPFLPLAAPGTRSTRSTTKTIATAAAAITATPTRSATIVRQEAQCGASRLPA